MERGQRVDPARRILPVILAGGIGARLVPISTPARPKPFVPLADGDSLLTKTLARLRGPQFLPPLLIGRAEDRFALLNHARAAHVTPAAILLEQQGRNTAVAIALAAQWARTEIGAGTMLAILPADHLIAPEEAWISTVVSAADAAWQSGMLCLLGATPTRPEPGFGYLMPGASSASRAWRKITRFVEKPSDAPSLIAAGARWNMGQFVGTVGKFSDALATYAPLIAQAAASVLASAERQYEFTELGPWPAGLESRSFDHAVLEACSSVFVPFTGQWQDLGNLDAWREATGLSPDHYAALPARTDRPWGYFENRAARNNEVHKLLILYPGCRLSRQKHQRRAEHWKVISGTAYIELDDTVQRLEQNQELTIPAGSWHRLANHHTDILIIEEIQMGICEESDIERIEDDYGRN